MSTAYEHCQLGFKAPDIGTSNEINVIQSAVEQSTNHVFSTTKGLRGFPFGFTCHFLCTNFGYQNWRPYHKCFKTSVNNFTAAFFFNSIFFIRSKITPMKMNIFHPFQQVMYLLVLNQQNFKYNFFPLFRSPVIFSYFKFVCYEIHSVLKIPHQSIFNRVAALQNVNECSEKWGGGRPCYSDSTGN